MTLLRATARKLVHRAGPGGDRGSVSVIGAVIAFGVVLTLLGTCFQAVLYFSGRSAALAAAQQGVEAARAENGTTAAGQAAACSFATSAGHGLLHNPACTSGGQATITVTVCGNITVLVPMVPAVHTCQQAEGPKERFTTRTAP